MEYSEHTLSAMYVEHVVHLFIIYHTNIMCASACDMEPLYAIIILWNDQEPFFIFILFLSFIFCLILTQLVPTDYAIILNVCNWDWACSLFFDDDIHSITSNYKKVWF